MGLFIFIAIILCVWLLWPNISRWLQRKAADKAEDYIRRATGMPPRPDSREGRRRQRSERREGFSASSSRRRYADTSDSPIIPPEYAEDVEYVETKDFSETTIGVSDSKGTRTYHESQVSDAEYVEIKKGKNG